MKNLTRSCILSVLVVLLVSSGCAVGPDYRKPAPLPGDAALPSAFKEAEMMMRPAVPRDAEPRGQWWHLFVDSTLDCLMAELEANNQGIAANAALYRQAVSTQEQAWATLWPQISATGSASRGKSTSGGSVTSPATLGLESSWELDLWGKIRRGYESIGADTQAAAADLAAARLSLQAQLVTSYASLRVVDRQRQLLDNTAAAYARSLELTKNRYRLGVASRSDVAQAETQLQNTLAQATDLGVQRSSLEHAIAVLVGRAPADFSLPADPEHVLTLPAIPPAIPSEVLERRPDVAAAERRVAAANAQIGVAEAAFFPNVTLDASGGYRNNALSGLISVPNQVWSVGASMAATIFDSGARRAKVAGAMASYDQVVANYRQTVLAALQETEDNLAALRILAQEEAQQQLAVESARIATTLAMNQYRAGTVSYLNVLVVQASQLNAERTLLTIKNQQYTAAVALIKAIGGGWQELNAGN